MAKNTYVELLCGCQCGQGPGGDIHKRCREAKALLKAAGPTCPLGGSPEWDAYADHYRDKENVVVRRLVDGQWQDEGS